VRAESEAEEIKPGRWLNSTQAFRHFGFYSGPTQSAQHIRPLHWYVACRLAIEGGFNPDDITPRPPFAVQRRGGEQLISFDPSKATAKERTVLGGLKTKNVDVVVTRNGLGPVLAVSCKGITGAFRNLTNRMEETIGECTNLHITYPALVFGFLFAIRANQETEAAVAVLADESAPPAKQLAANDIAIRRGGEPVESILRYHAALREMTGRKGIRNDLSRYEAVSLVMVDLSAGRAGTVLPGFPPAGSPLRWEHFLKALYLRYDERYVYSAPDLNAVTRRLAWAAGSPALATPGGMPAELDYEARVGGEDTEEV
jgi:hypothetical protein